MKISSFFQLCTCVAALFLLGCERDLEDLSPATFPTNGDVFIDGFTGGLNYAAFGGSDPTAFQVDMDETYDGTASMRFEVPDFEDPAGAYAGGSFFLTTGRDLSGYNALTFWARASQAANIDVVGFGNDLGANTYQVAINGLAVTTNWQKYYIPIPDPSLLTQEKGMFFYSEGPEDGRGYTFWVDEVQFENVGTLSDARPVIFDGQDREETAGTGDVFSANAYVSFNLPEGVDQRVTATPAYFTYASSDPSVATVDGNGQVTVVGPGTATITARVGDIEAAGSLLINATGMATGPQQPAPTPTLPAEDVISIFSNPYENVPVDFYNGFWEGSTTLNNDVDVNGDDIIRYTNLNFVGIQFTDPTQDISDMTRFRIDVWTPEPTAPPAEFKVLLFDVGPDLSFGTGDDSQHEITVTSPLLTTENWVTIDVPLTDFPGLTGRRNLAQVVLSGSLSEVYVDNILFYRGEDTGGSDTPTTAAPMPPARDEDDVISVFSDTYGNIGGTNLNPDWGQATVTTEVDIAGNNTLRYGGLNYQGTELGSAQNVSDLEFLHLDYWTSNSTMLNVFLISEGPTETGVALEVPTMGWNSVDIPLADFDPVDLANVIQMKFDGNGDIYLDNIYFYRGDGDTGGSEPGGAAPTPTLPTTSVISLFSDAYDDVAVETWRTSWSMAVLEDVMVAGNPTKKYSELDFVGVETLNNQVDASAMTAFHLDVWSADYTALGVKLVDAGADGMIGTDDDVEHQVDFPMPARGEWVSLDIPLSDFTGLTTRANLAQYIFAGQPTSATTIYVDNVYFHD